jgi:DNA-binding NarL/FixJ family response regulator
MVHATCGHSLFLVSNHSLVQLGVQAAIGTQTDLVVAGQASEVDAALIGIAETSPDIVIVDASLQRADRFVLVERIQARHPQTPVLALTLREETDFARQLLDTGVRGFVLSCSNAEEIIHAIRSILSGGIYLDPGVAAKLLAKIHPAASAEVQLSEREIMVVKLVAKGFSNKEISRQLSLSVKTVETYRARASEKLGLRTRAAIVQYATTEGWMMSD